MDYVCNRCLFSIPSKVEMAEEQEYLQRTEFGSSRKLGGPAEHLIDGSEKRIWRLSF